MIDLDKSVLVTYSRPCWDWEMNIRGIKTVAENVIVPFMANKMGTCVKKSLLVAMNSTEVSSNWSITSMKLSYESTMRSVPCRFSLYRAWWTRVCRCKCPNFLICPCAAPLMDPWALAEPLEEHGYRNPPDSHRQRQALWAVSKQLPFSVLCFPDGGDLCIWPQFQASTCAHTLEPSRLDDRF